MKLLRIRMWLTWSTDKEHFYVRNWADGAITMFAMVWHDFEHGDWLVNVVVNCSGA